MAEVSKIGFTIDQAENLQKSVKEKFDALGEAISTPWITLRGVLHGEWRGEDEISYEEEFVKKVNGLYGDCIYLCDATRKTIESITNGWIKVQNTNVIKGANVGTLSEVNWGITIADNYESIQIIQSEKEDLTASSFRGLTSGLESAAHIKSAMDTYIDNLKGVVDTTLKYIEDHVTDAFAGNQVDSIKSFAEKIRSRVKTVITAQRDMYILIDKLAKETYETVDTESVSTMVSSTDSKIQDSVDKVVAKWDNPDSVGQ